MTTRRRRPASRPMRSVQKKATRWTTATLNAQSSNVGTEVAFDALGALTVADKNEIRRVVTVHFDFDYSSDAATQHVFGRFGLIVVSDDAMAVPQVPDPVGDADASWMMNHHYHTEADNSDPPRVIRDHVKVSRLIPPKYTLAFVLEVTAGGVGALHWSVGMRLLLEHR